MFLINERAVILIKARKRRGAFRLHYYYARHTLDQPTLQQLAKAFAKRGTISEIPARQHEMIRHLPAKLFRELERDRLLAFDAKRIDRVNQINRAVFGEFANHVHANVEVAFNLEHLRTVVQRLRELRMTHLTTGNDDRARQIGACRVRRETRRRVARAGAREEARASTG